MKGIAVLLIAILSCGIVAAQSRAEDDPQVTHDIVQRAFSEVSAGMYTSWSEKYLARLGDSVAPEIVKHVSIRGVTRKDVATALELVKMSFANPRFIRQNENRTELHRRIRNKPG